MKLKHIQKAAQSLLKIKGTQEISWLGNKLWVDEKEYPLPVIHLEGNGNRVVATTMDPQEILRAMHGYAQKIVEYDPKEHDHFPGHYLHTLAFFDVVSLPFYRIWDGGRERTREYEEKGYPVLLEIIEHNVKAREALVMQVFSENGPLLSKKENVSPQLMQLIGTVTKWKEEILPALRKNKFVRGHLEMEEAMDRLHEKRSKPGSRLVAADMQAANRVLLDLQQRSRGKKFI